MNKGLYTGLQKGTKNGLAKGLFNGNFKGLYINSPTLNNVNFLAYQQNAGSNVPATQQDIYKRTFRNLEDSNIINQLDRLWILAAFDTNLLVTSLINPSSTKATLVNSPTIISMLGLQGNGSSSYLNSNFTPSTQAVKSTQNSTCFGTYITANYSSQASMVEYGGYDGTRAIATYNYWTGGNVFINANDNGSGTGIVSSFDARGITHYERTSSTARNVYKNGKLLFSDTQTSTGLPTRVMYIGAWDNLGTASNFSNRVIGAAYHGSSSVNQSVLFDIISQHMQAIGASVF